MRYLVLLTDDRAECLGSRVLLMGVIGFDMVYGSTEDDTLGGVTATKVKANEEFVEDEVDMSQLMGMDSFQPMAMAA